MAYNEFFTGKKLVSPKNLWQEQNDILFPGIFGISPIGAINENFF
jgi:hypothetical protein